MNYIYHHIQSLCHHTTLLMTSESLYESTSCLEVKIYNIQVTSEPFSVSSQQLYRKRHTHSLYDITLIISVASFALYKTSYPHFMTSNHRFLTPHPYIWHGVHCICAITSTLSHQTTVFMMSYPLPSWHHTPCIRHCTHCIFVITNSLLISHPLLYDILPTFCVISYALYITSHPILMSSHYSTYDIRTSIYESTSCM